MRENRTKWLKKQNDQRAILLEKLNKAKIVNKEEADAAMHPFFAIKKERADISTVERLSLKEVNSFSTKPLLLYHKKGRLGSWDSVRFLYDRLPYLSFLSTASKPVAMRPTLL